MKKGLYLLLILVVLLASCSKKNELIGTFTDKEYNGKQVYLLAMEDFDSPFTPIDSTMVSDNKFRFNLQDSIPQGIAYILVKDVPQGLINGVPFVYEKGQIHMRIDSVAHVSGTPLNDTVQAFFDKLDATYKKSEILNQKIYKTSNEVDRQGYIGELERVNNDISNEIYGFVKNNIKNKVGEYYFIQFIEGFDKTQVKSLLNMAEPQFKKDIEDIIGESVPEEGVNFVGQNYIDISGQALNGQKISLSDYIGKNKLVLVDFWASWCPPCREEMPDLVAVYNKYHNKGFEIVGVSLDDNKANWVKGLNEMHMSWPQMSDLKGWDSSLSRAYQVSSIPFSILIDQNGKIIAQNLTSQELDEKLSELL